MSFILAFLYFCTAHADSGMQQISFSLPVDVIGGQQISLDGRIDRPIGEGKWPVLIMSPGSGPSDVDFIMDRPNVSQEDCEKWQGEFIPPSKCRWRFYEMTAKNLAQQGIAVIRLGKRGVNLDANRNPLPPNMAIHGTSTLSKRVEDLEKLIAYLDNYPELDLSQLYLYGFSEGTVISTLMAKKYPAKIKGLVLVGAVLDYLENIFHFQTVGVQWSQLLAQADLDKNARITRDEFNVEKLRKPNYLNLGAPSFGERIRNYEMMGINIDFDYFDRNHDGFMDQSELESRLNEDIWLPSLAALKNNDREGFRKYDPDAGVNSFEQVKEWYSSGRMADFLLELNIPISIFIGSHDLNTPPSQLDWFIPLVKARNRQEYIYTELADDAHNGPNLTAAAARRISVLGWGRFGH